MVVEGMVSTVIPVFNRAEMLQEAVASVLAQDYHPKELLIVDDGSTDQTGDVADDIAKRHPDDVKVIHVTNRGPGAAREVGRLAAMGEFIQYLDSDDLLLPGKFQGQVEGLRAHPNCGVAYGKTRFWSVRHSPGDRPWKRTGERIETMFPAFLESRWWATSTPLYRRSLLDDAGPWTALQNEEDWEYDCRIASRSVRLFYLPQFVSEHRDHAGDRLSDNGSIDPTKLADRAKARLMIYQHACNAGIAASAPEMQHFARAAFLLARQCGAAGLPTEARDLFDLAREASIPSRAKGIDFRIYRAFATAFGWANAGRVGCYLDKFRR